MSALMKKQHGLPVTYIALDWHEMDKQLKTEGIIEALWSTLRSVLPRHGFALGQLVKVGPDHLDAASEGAGARSSDSAVSERCSSAAGRGWQSRWFKQQRGITRYNCADSLDRTNVASYFGAVQVSGAAVGVAAGPCRHRL